MASRTLRGNTGGGGSWAGLVCTCGHGKGVHSKRGACLLRDCTCRRFRSRLELAKQAEAQQPGGEGSQLQEAREQPARPVQGCGYCLGSVEACPACHDTTGEGSQEDEPREPEPGVCCCGKGYAGCCPCEASGEGSAPPRVAAVLRPEEVPHTVCEACGELYHATGSPPHVCATCRRPPSEPCCPRAGSLRCHGQPKGACGCPRCRPADDADLRAYVERLAELMPKKSGLAEQPARDLERWDRDALARLVRALRNRARAAETRAALAEARASHAEKARAAHDAERDAAARELESLRARVLQEVDAGLDCLPAPWALPEDLAERPQLAEVATALQGAREALQVARDLLTGKGGRHG